MSDASDRARRLREKRARLKARGDLRLAADPERVDALLAAEDGAEERAAAVAEQHRQRFEGLPVDVDPDQLVAELRAGLAAANDEAFVRALRRSAIDAVVRPFGLGALVAAADRRGGHVLTLRNAERAHAEGWGEETADPMRVADHARRTSGVDYDRRHYEEGISQRRKDRFKDPEPLTDAYTGKPLTRDGQTHVDHVVSAHELHTDSQAAFHLTRDQTEALAVSDENMAFVDGSLNQSKQEKPLREWMATERRSGETNQERYEVDEELALERDDDARAHIAKKVRAEAAKGYAKDFAGAAVKQAGRMALQQALGLLLVEFVEGCFDELAALWADRHSERSFSEWLGQLGQAAHRVAARVAARWKDAGSALGEGAVSGLLSSLATSLANLFVSTGRRLVRILREGVHSLFQAVRLLATRPEGMTPQQARHEATKLFAGALGVTVGIGVEELVEKALASVPALTPFAGTLSAVIVGVATGLATAALVRELDRLDLFGVQAIGEREGVLALLDTRLDEALDRLEAAPSPA